MTQLVEIGSPFSVVFDLFVSIAFICGAPESPASSMFGKKAAVDEF